MTDAERELYKQEMLDSLAACNNALQVKCTKQSIKVGALLDYNDYVMEKAKAVIQRLSEIRLPYEQDK